MTFLDGRLYIASFNIASQIDLKPRAPNLNSIALSTIKSKTLESIFKSIPSISNRRIYCFISAFLGSVKILLRASAFKGIKYDRTGNLPINSGISPKVLMSVGLMYLNKDSLSIDCPSISVGF